MGGAPDPNAAAKAAKFGNQITAAAAEVATAANAGNKAAANAALARVTKAAANRSALAGVPANAGLGAIVAKAKANASRAQQVAKNRAAAEAAAAKAAAEANKAAKAAEAKAAAEANKAAKAAAAKAAANAKAAAAANAAAKAKTAAAAEAARKAQEAAAKQARNAAAAQAKAEANAANAAKKSEEAKIREFVLKLWPLTKGNFKDGVWSARIRNNKQLKEELNKIKGNVTYNNYNAVVKNIIKAERNRAIGHWGPRGLAGANKNLTQRMNRARKLVNIAFPEIGAAAKIAARWRGGKVRGAFLNVAAEAAKAAMAARAAAAVPGGSTKSQDLAKQMRLAKIAENLRNTFINGQGQINKPANFNKINKTLLQGLTKNEIVAHLKGEKGFKPGNTRGFTNANLEKMAKYFSP